MELPCLLISWVNPFPSRVINRTIFFCNALESHECACCFLSFLYFHWLFPLLARETSPRNRSIYKSTRERVDSRGLCGRWRLHLMGSWQRVKPLRRGQFRPFSKCSHFSNIRCFLQRFIAHNNSNVVVESLFAPFGHFLFLTQTDHFAKAIASALWPIWAIFKMLSFFEY